MARTVFQSPKGIKDVLPDEQAYWLLIEEKIRNIVRAYGYKRLTLPVFEETGLFARGVGQGTDIVEKEMYTFEDKGGNSITLRPEFTAGVMRAYLQHGMASTPKPVKLWSFGPVFRYERPQAGRFRQHTQFNVEALGEQDPALDFEVMSVAFQLYEELGFKNLSFQINSIGCPKCRPNYLDKLKEYYKEHINEVCDDCKRRIITNPLRVLDCKRDQCQPVIKNAPPISEHLCSECKEHFNTLKLYLDNAGRPYQVNHRLVRGLDYYTKTVFEVWAQGIGAQNAVCGGGRYDGLSEAIGGSPTPGVGFASGIERIVLTLQAQENIEIKPEPPLAFFAIQSIKAKSWVVQTVSVLRSKLIPVVMAFGERSLKAQLREANRRNVCFAIIAGEEEFEKKKVQIKFMNEQKSLEIPFNEVVDFLLKNKEDTA